MPVRKRVAREHGGLLSLERRRERRPAVEVAVERPQRLPLAFGVVGPPDALGLTRRYRRRRRLVACGLAIMAVVAIADAGLYWNIPRLGNAARGALWIALVIAIDAARLRAARRRCEMSESQLTYTRTMPRYYLECRGAEEDLQELQDLVDQSFPPVIVGEAYQRKGTWEPGTLTATLIAICVLAGGSPMLGLVVGTGMSFLSRLIVQEYFRVSPGRIEVLCCTPLSARVSLEKRIETREATVVARLDAGVMTVVPRHGEDEPLVVDLETVAEPMLLVRSVFQSAGNPDGGGPLPMDKFLD